VIRTAAAPLAAPLALGVLLGACSKHAETPAVSSIAASEAAPVVAAIPQGMRGRWGVVPNDCVPGRADAKGLMIVDAGSLKFYESRGQLDAVVAGDATHLRARFAMTGEGMNWTREQAFVLDPANDVLVRREFGDDAIPRPLTYHRCPRVIDSNHREPPRNR
jgi:hypothetical protein